MCGIFGIVFADEKTVPDRNRLKTTLNLLKHRGPDSSGTHVEAGVGFAHTRLSLVDLSDRSRQPFWDSEGRFCLVYNGEIYNFKELRQDLENEGVHFRTTSDTEVLLQSLIVRGPKATLPKLEGMFAFAWYDRRERILTLARDRFGIKPLYIYRDERVFLFASEVKAMKPWIQLKPNPFIITSYLLGYDGPLQDTSFYGGVRSVPPGSLLTLTIGEAPRHERFTELPDLLDPNQAEELNKLKPEQLIDRIDDLLQRSVRQMLFADAPVGILCSGGVDSSIITAMAARCHDNLAIFHADVKGPSSEYHAALSLSRHLKLDLEKVDVHNDDFIDLIPEVTDHYERPFFRHHHSIPFLMVSKLIRRHGVKGVLSGEGADECYIGYQQIVREPLEEFYLKQLRRVETLVRRIPRIGKVLWPGRLDGGANLVRSMLNGFEREIGQRCFRMAYKRAMGAPADRNVRTLDMLADHLCALLHRNDTMGMAASIEARFPFLDERLVKTAINLPYNAKVRFSPTAWERAHPFLRDKWVVRKVADRYLPRQLSRRKKAPFTVTAFQSMKIPTSYFGRSFVADYFELTEPGMDLLLSNAEQGLKVRLLLLDVWGRLCLGGTAGDAVGEQIRAHVTFGPKGDSREVSTGPAAASSESLSPGTSKPSA